MPRASVSRRSSTPSGAQVDVEAEMGKPRGIVYTRPQRAIHSPLHNPRKRRARLKAVRHADCYPIGQAARQVMLLAIPRRRCQGMVAGAETRQSGVIVWRVPGFPCVHTGSVVGDGRSIKRPKCSTMTRKGCQGPPRCTGPHSSCVDRPSGCRLEKERGLYGNARGAPGKALIDEETPRGGRRISKSFGLALPIGIVIVILMRQDALIWVGLKAPDTAKRTPEQHLRRSIASRSHASPRHDNGKMLPIVVYLSIGTSPLERGVTRLRKH